MQSHIGSNHRDETAGVARAVTALPRAIAGFAFLAVVIVGIAPPASAQETPIEPAGVEPTEAEIAFYEE